MGVMRPIFLKNVPVPASQTTEIDLPRSTIYKDLFLEFTFDITIGVAAATLHEDGLASWLSRVAVVAQGLPAVFDMDGFSAKMLAEYQAGTTLLPDVTAVGVGANQIMRFYLPITFLLRDANNEFTTLFDARGLPELKLRLETRAIDGAAPFTPGGGGTVVLNSCTVNVTADVWDTDQAAAGIVMETRRALLGATQVTTGPGGLLVVDLLKGGLFRGALLIARTLATLAGVRTDARPANVSIRRNVSDMIVDRVPWRTLQLRGTYDQTFLPPAGVLYLSLDPEGALQRDSLLDTARVPGAQESLALEFELATQPVTWTVVPEYLILRGR